MDENVNNDWMILLSSSFIYNLLKPINESSLDSISLIVNLAKGIQVKSSAGVSKSALKLDHEIAQYFPQLLWVL
jgi:hypothetical protein